MKITNTGTKSGCLKKFSSCRWVAAFMLCFLRICQTALRQSIGMALVCMAERPVFGEIPGNSPSLRDANGSSFDPGDGTAAEGARNRTGVPDTYSVIFNNETDGATSGNCDSGSREFLWDAAFEGLVLSSYYYGFLLTPLIASYIEMVMGPKRLIVTAVAVGAVVNFLTPELTRAHRYLLVALRVAAGATNGMIDPPVQTLWASWAPKPEIAYLTAVEYGGVSIGGIFTFLISGLLCQIPLDNGWPLVFYFYGSLNLLWVALGLVLIYNTPSSHPRISAEELAYISAETQSAQFSKRHKKISPPWLKMLTSPPVWAIVIATASFTWVYSWVLCYLPMYMQDVLHYNMTQNAMLSSLPFVGKFVAGLVCGYLADRLLRTSMSVACNRKLFQMIGCFGCATCTVVIGFLDYRMRTLAVVLLILAVSSQNITSVAFRINSLDIAPRYAGFILGLSSTVAVAMSMTAPLVTSAVVYDKSQEQWQIMFYVVAALCVIGGLAFVIMASGTLQDWATSTAVEGGKETNQKDGLTVILTSKHDICEHQNGEHHHSQHHLDHLADNSIKGSLLGSTSLDHQSEALSPGTDRRHDQWLAVKVLHDLDAASQWSSCLSLTA